MGWEQGVRRVGVDTGLGVVYAQQGDRFGRPVVLLHAWGESRGSFDRLVEVLPPSLHVLAPDQRGHGDSSKPLKGYALDSLAADVVAFLDAVRVPSAVLVGSSSGGYVAQQVAVRSPDRVAGLVLIGSPPSLHGRTEFNDEISRLSDPVDPAWVRGFVESFPLEHDVPDWYLEDRVRDGTRIPAAVWQASLAGLTTSPAPIETGAIQVPTLILWGDRDGLLDRQGQEALAAAIPGARLRVYEAVGHLVLWEQPGRVARDLVAFEEGLVT